MSTQIVPIYTNCLTLSAGCILYTASTMTAGTEAPNGYYSDGNGNCYRVLSSHGVGLGQVVNVSVCTTPAPFTFKLYNNTTSPNITEVTTPSGLAFFTQNEGGTFPLPPGDYIFGYGNTSQSVGVRIANGVGAPWCQKLYRDGILVQSVTVNGNNIHYFPATTFTAGQEMKIILQNGSC